MRISTTRQLLQLLDGLFVDGADWTSRDAAEHWADVLSREGHPLNSDLPDANLLHWTQRGFLPASSAEPESPKALDVGCGLGRNSRWLDRAGFSVTGIDIASYAVAEARLRSQGLATTYLESDFLREDVPGSPFDLVYDSGCFHHIAPHRRITYVEALHACLALGGLFGIVSFAPGKIDSGSETDDLTLMRNGQLEGGIAYSLEDLRQMFSAFELLDIRSMPHPSEIGEAAFYQDFLNVALFRKPTA